MSREKFGNRVSVSCRITANAIEIDTASLIVEEETLRQRDLFCYTA